MKVLLSTSSQGDKYTVVFEAAVKEGTKPIAFSEYVEAPDLTSALVRAMRLTAQRMAKKLGVETATLLKVMMATKRILTVAEGWITRNSVQRVLQNFSGSSDLAELPPVFSVSDMQSRWREAKQGGLVNYYKKFGTVHARRASDGERITTQINGQAETTNTAQSGDWIVTGAKGEQYILSDDKFSTRYAKTAKPGEYRAVGGCFAFELPAGISFRFLAPWGEEMLANGGDYLASTKPTGDDDIYRIERSVFHSTYRSAQVPDSYEL